MISERKAASMLGLNTAEFRRNFVTCANPQLHVILLQVDGKPLRKYDKAEIESFILKNRYIFSNNRKEQKHGDNIRKGKAQIQPALQTF